MPCSHTCNAEDLSHIDSLSHLQRTACNVNVSTVTTVKVHWTTLPDRPLQAPISIIAAAYTHSIVLRAFVIRWSCTATSGGNPDNR
jgi:hypothetical protein